MPSTESSLVDVIESRATRLSELAFASYQALKASAGDRPAFSVPLTRREQALRYLGLWLVLFQAALTVSAPACEAMIQKRGPAATLAWDKAMRKLAEDEDVLDEALQALSPQLRSTYEALLLGGLHAGVAGTPFLNQGLTKITVLARWEKRAKSLTKSEFDGHATESKVA